MGAFIKRLLMYLRYDWPLHFVLWITNWLPDNSVFLRLRGFLATPFFGECGKNLRLGRGLDIYNPINLRFGNDIYLAYGCVFIAIDTIVINDEVMFGPYVVLVSDNHTRVNRSFRYGQHELKSIKIERGSWIGAHVVINAGVTIGEGSLVASGAVVTKNVPNDSMVGGVPAKMIRHLDSD